MLYLNLAAGYLRIKDYKNSISACNEALLIDPRNIKALLRRSKCRTQNIKSEVSDLQKAIKDLKTASNFSSSNIVKKELAKAKRILLVYRKDLKATFRGIFSSEQ